MLSPTGELGYCSLPNCKRPSPPESLVAENVNVAAKIRWQIEVTIIQHCDPVFAETPTKKPELEEYVEIGQLLRDIANIGYRFRREE